MAVVLSLFVAAATWTDADSAGLVHGVVALALSLCAFGLRYPLRIAGVCGLPRIALILVLNVLFLGALTTLVVFTQSALLPLVAGIVLGRQWQARTTDGTLEKPGGFIDVD